MRAWVLGDHGQLGMTQKPTPVQKMAEVLVRIDAVAICATDLEIISPGPGVPRNAGVSIELVKRLGPRVPTLGVCLGHQAIVEAFGGTIGPAKKLVHGKSSSVHHDGLGIFARLPQDFEAGRYHSLAADEVPDCFEISARGDDEVMAVRHKRFPIDGVQFHPESVLTPAGPELAKSFLEGRR